MMKELLPALLAFPCLAADARIETDPRLHSDGKGWKLNQATLKDPKRALRELLS